MLKVLYLKNNYKLSMKLKIFLTSLLLIFFNFSVNAEESKIRDQNTEFNVYTGMFDFSDDGKRSNLFGAEFVNFSSSKDTIIGMFSL